MNYSIVYIFNRIIRLSILFFILYLIFTNPGAFLMIIASIFIIGYFLFQYLKRKIKTKGFNFQFNAQDFSQNSNFNFNDFSNFANQPKFDEIQKAKNFFGFSDNITKDDIKKRYKELARKYHPDINKGDDTKMKELNHFRDILIKAIGEKEYL